MSLKKTRIVIFINNLRLLKSLRFITEKFKRDRVSEQIELNPITGIRI